MMKKKAAIPLLILLGGGIFFYLAGGLAEIPARPTPSAPTSTAPTSTATTSTAQASTSAPQETLPVILEKPPAAKMPRVKIGALTVPVELAQTPAEVQKGLSGRLSLDPDKGMLFLFSQADTYRFWMPDMNFPIDIVWISSARKVVGVAANVSNDFDPANPKFYTPPSPAQYVLEVNAGFASRTGIKAGDSVAFIDI